MHEDSQRRKVCVTNGEMHACGSAFDVQELTLVVAVAFVRGDKAVAGMVVTLVSTATRRYRN